MKKVILSSIAAATLSSSLYAADPSLYPSSITFFTGYQMFSNDCEVNSNQTYSFRFTQNDFGIESFGLGAFQIAADYTPDMQYKGSKETTSSVKLGSNLIWYIDSVSEITPYFLIGGGLEHISNPQNGFSFLDFYMNGAVGAEYMLRDDISLVGEAKYSYADPKRKGTSVSAGLKFSFGE